MDLSDSGGARRYWPTAAAIGIGVLLSVAAFDMVWTLQLRTADGELAAQVNESHKATQEGLSDYEDLIRGVVAHVEGSGGRVKQEVFTVAVARLLAPHEGVAALGYAPRVAGGARGAYEMLMRAHTSAGLEIFDLTEAGKRIRAGDSEQYFPIGDVVPLSGNEPLLGLDLGSWRSVLERASDSGDLQSTDLIGPAHNDMSSRGQFFVVGPVYASSASTVGERRAGLLGFAVAAFRIDKLFGTILRTRVIARGFDEYIFHGAAADPAALVLVHSSKFRDPRDAPGTFVAAFAKPELTRTLTFAGQTWTTVSVPLARLHPRTAQADAWGALAGGFIITALVGLYLYAAARRLRSASAAAASLRASEERFRMLIEQAPDAILVFDYDQARVIDANRSAERLFACPREELINVGPQHFYPPEQPDASPVGASFEEHNRRALAGETVAYERRVRNAQGQELICEVQLARLASSAGRLLRASFVDVTERKRSEELLRRSEESLRTIFDSVNDVIIVHDLHTGAFIDFNARLHEMFGYSREELLKLDLGGLMAGVAPYTIADAASILKRAAAGQAVVFEWQCKAKDGHLICVEVSLRRAMLGGRDVLLSTARDVTERRRAIETLTYRDRILHAVTRSAAELVSGSSLETAMPHALQIVAEALQVDRMLVLDRSPRAPGPGETSLAYGWQADDVPALNDDVLAKHPADSKELAAWLAPLLEGQPVMTDAETASGFVSRIMRELGNRSTLLLPISVAGEYWGHIGVDDCKTQRQWTSAELDALGALVGVMGALLQREHAQTALQQSEQRFRTIYESVNEGIFLVDPVSRRVVDVNPPGCEMFGYSREEIIGRDIASLSSGVHPYTHDAAMAVLERAQANGPQTFEWQAKNKAGGLFWAELSIRFTMFGSRDLVLATVRNIDERKRDEETIRRQADQYATMLSTTADGFWILNTDGKFVEVSDVYCRMTGYSRDELLALHVNDIDAVESPVEAGAHVARVLAAGFDRFETRQRRKDGSVFDAEVSTSFRAGAGQLLCFARDVTDIKRIERGLADSEIRLRTVLETNVDGIVVVDAETMKFQFANRAFCDMLGYGVDELPAIGVLDIHPTETLPSARAAFASQLEGKIRMSPDFPVKRKDGSTFFADIAGSTMTLAGRMYMVACFHDVTERKRAEEQIMRMAKFDVLTGLANRAVFVEALEQTIARARREGNIFAVLYLDLDHFKDVNDTLGHPIGDRLLQDVAQRFRAAVRETDTVARFGGDEFAVIEIDIREPADAAVLADKLLNAISEPFAIEGIVVRSGTSVGIAVFGPDSTDAETLLSHADVALYRAKQEGRGTYRFFTDAMDAEVRNRVSLEADLRAAISAGQLYLEYQPQVDNLTDRIVGLEALVRWQHPKRGLVSPDEFIPVAEQSGLIVPLGHWVLREACRQMKLWLDAGIAPALMSVNLSGLQFKTPLELENGIAAVLAETGLPPQMLELEFTESVLMEVAREHNDVLLRLRDTGIKLAIDDFGNGYSSLDYLSRFPVDHIKIAQNFVLDLPTKPRNASIVRAAIHLAHELGLLVVVEGVETAEELAIIKSWGCRLVQGFYYSEPLPVAATTALLRVGSIIPDLPTVAVPAVA